MHSSYYCVLATGLLPIVSAWLAKAGKFTKNDNHTPREFQEAQRGWRKRAHWSQQNGFEAFPLFAAAVIIAHLKNTDEQAIATLSIAFIVVRVLYIAAYVADKAFLRSIFWALGLGLSIAIFLW